MGIAKKIAKLMIETSLVYSLACGNPFSTGYSGISENASHRQRIEEFKIEEIKLNEYLDGVVREKKPKDLAEAMKTNPSKLFTAIYRNVEKRYLEDNNFYGDLEKLLKSKKQQLDHARRVFLERGIPAEYISVPIVESRMKHDAVSKKNAVGAYQFIKATSKKHDPHSINEVQDVRRNPIIAAKLAAMEFEELFKMFRNSDLALAAYNSSKPKKYLKEALEKGVHNLTLEGYVQYLGEELNREESSLKYIWENLEYIAKNRAIAKIIQDSYPEVFENDENENMFKVYTMKNPSQEIRVVVGSGENLRTAIRRTFRSMYGFATTEGTNWAVNYIKAEGRIVDVNKVSPKQEFMIPGPKNFEEFEKRFGINLRKNNEHILDSSKPLLKETKIVLSEQT